MSSATCRLIPLLILLPASLAAQATLDSVARRLRPGQMVRLHSQTGQRAEGRFTAYHPDPAVVQLAMRDTTIPFSMIDSIWVRKTGANTGAMVGALVVGVPSAIFWGALCGSDGGSNSSECGGTVALLTVAGAGAGALLGAAIGSTSSRWQLRYAAPQVALRFAPLPSQRLESGSPYAPGCESVVQRLSIGSWGSQSVFDSAGQAKHSPSDIAPAFQAPALAARWVLPTRGTSREDYVNPRTRS